MEPATQVARPRPPRTRKTAPTTPKAPVPAPRATRPWLLSTAAARRPRRPSQVVELDLQEERTPARIRDARFPRGAIAVIEVAQGERRLGVEPVANAEGRLQRIRDLQAQAAVVHDVRHHVWIVVRRERGDLADAWGQG